MKSLLLLLSLLFGVGCTAQENLRKYSYSFMGYSFQVIGRPSMGTCFFLREKNKLFLIKAAHVVTGCNDSAKKEYGHPPILNVLMHDENDNPIGVFNVPIQTYIDSIPCDTTKLIPDIIVIEVNQPDSIKNKIFSVEKILYPPFRNVSQIFMFGYPERAYKNVEFGFCKAAFNSYKGDESTFVGQTNYPHGIDSVNYWLYNQKGTIDSSLKGFSGSPIFIKDGRSNKYRVCGLFAAYGLNNETEKKYILIPRIEIILKEIRRQSH